MSPISKFYSSAIFNIKHYFSYHSMDSSTLNCSLFIILILIYQKDLGNYITLIEFTAAKLVLQRAINCQIYEIF